MLPSFVGKENNAQSTKFIQCWEIKLFIVQILSCVWFCYTMDFSTSGSSLFHYLLEFAQIHVHWVSDANSEMTLILPNQHQP